MMELQNMNPWGKYRRNNHHIEELSDVDNMIDENQLEPDYYIDRPVNFLNF
jgi:hypothetical protein